jgi:porin
MSAQSSPSTDRRFEQYLFGDWWGSREKLANSGIQPAFVIVTDPFGNPTGGERRGFTDYTLIGLDVRLDTEMMGGWRGGQFTIGGAISFGNNLTNQYVGNTYLVQLASVTTSQPRLTYLSYMQTFAEGKLNLLVGRLTINSLQGDEFMGSAYFKSLTSVGFDLLPQGIFLNSPGAYGYPATTWGGRIKYSPADKFYVQAGVYNGDPNQKDGVHHGLDLSMRGPLFTIGEIGLRWNYGEEDSGLARNIKLGGYYDGGAYKTSVSGTSATRGVNGLYGFYVLGDQQLWRWNDDRHRRPVHPNKARLGDSERDRHAGVFGAFMAAPQARLNTVPYFFDAGLVAYGPTPKRPRDFAALGFVYGSFQNSPLHTGELLVQSDNEETLEITYGYTLRPGLLLQPALQYLLNPRGNPLISATLPANGRVPNALAAGINIVINP